MTANAYDDLKVINMALVELGENPIESFEQPETDIEGTVGETYILYRDTLLSEHPWNFANPLRQLAANADADEVLKAGYKHAFRLPNDLLAGPFAIYANRNFKDPIQAWENSDNHILCDEDVIHARYRRHVDISSWPIYVIRLLVMICAAHWAKPIADNTQLAQEKRILAYGPAELDGNGGLYKKAKQLDAMANPLRSLFGNGNPLSATRY